MHRVTRRTTPIIVSVLLALAFTACGDVDPAADTTDTTAPTTPPATSEPVDTGYEHPTGADEVVLGIEQEGGFATPEMIFARLPTLLVSGDGRQFTPGPQIAIYPGPLLPNVQVADIGEEGIQALLALADDHGLLQDREYEAPTNIADATDTVVTIRVGGETYVHRAYALGIEDRLGEAGTVIEDEERQQLADFVVAAGSELRVDTEDFSAERYLVEARPVDDLGGFEVEPTVLPWPAEVDVDLSSADCVEIDAEATGDTFAEADQLTFFEQDDAIYQLAVKPALPGSSC